MPQLVIAEKPSVAQSIAGVLGASQRNDGYLEGNGYLVSWWSWRSQPPTVTTKNGGKRICPFSPKSGNIRLP